MFRFENFDTLDHYAAIWFPLKMGADYGGRRNAIVSTGVPDGSLGPAKTIYLTVAKDHKSLLQ